MVMKLFKDISGKNHYAYCDNLFTSVQFLKDLLVCDTYCSGTIQVSKKSLPDGTHNHGRMICGAFISTWMATQT